jgi:pimeloyl-ACP methyl ester carboxylesterase
VVLWKGYDNPPDLFAAAESSAFFAAELARAPQELADFVAALPLRLDQTLTVVAHSFGSTVTGAALADCGMRCTDVVVAGSPGMTVDGLAQLHIDSSHFFAEAAPGDAVAGLGVFGSSPSSPTFGGTRMRTNLDGYAQVRGHSSYFMPGSQALQNIADVVTGRGRRVQIHQTTVPEAVGGSVAWVIRVPTIPLGVIGRRYRGPGFRLLIDSRRLVDVTATQTGNAVREILEVCERATDHAVALAAMVMRTSGDTGIDAHDEGGEPA